MATKLRMMVFFLTFTMGTTYGQIKKIVLQIDTIVNQDFYQDFNIYTKGQHDYYHYLIADSFCKRDFLKNSVTCNLTIQSDSVAVLISLDKKGGYLELNNIYYQLADTIRINKHQVIDINYPDTNWTTINYYYYDYDTLGKLFKTKKFYTIDKIRIKKDEGYKISYIINGARYLCTTKWKSNKNEVNVTHFHGHGKKGLFRRRPFRYHGETIHTNTYNVITIQLKNKE